MIDINKLLDETKDLKIEGTKSDKLLNIDIDTLLDKKEYRFLQERNDPSKNRD